MRAGGQWWPAKMNTRYLIFFSPGACKQEKAVKDASLRISNINCLNNKSAVGAKSACKRDRPTRFYTFSLFPPSLTPFLPPFFSIPLFPRSVTSNFFSLIDQKYRQIFLLFFFFIDVNR